MSLNTDKCKVENYYRIKNPTIFTYSIFNTDLLHVGTFKDLWILFNTKLSFTSHTMSIKNKAIKTLGLIKRSCYLFNPPLVF